jgi:predicted glycosyltransferase involved in capsule biosynthesis
MDISQINGLVDVVIPVLGRPEVVATIFSLLSSNSLVHKVILVDGSPNSHQGMHISNIIQDPRLEIVHHPSIPFSKSSCLNRGLQFSTGKLILVSDADIIWPPESLAQMVECIQHGWAMCHVAWVDETDTSTEATIRSGYEFALQISQPEHSIEIRSRQKCSTRRPGCGLVLAPRGTWERVGGYCEEFVGWGWEDQDLLIRTQLLGLSVTSVARVIHLSHTDQRRNASLGAIDPTLTRNKNIIKSVQRLSTGMLMGNMKPNATEFRHAPVRVEFANNIESEIKRAIE